MTMSAATLPSEWRTFERPECGDVEDIDIIEMSVVTVYPCKGCGATLEMIDESDAERRDSREKQMTVTIKHKGDEPMPTQELGRASIALSKHLGLRQGSTQSGFVGCGKDELIVYIQMPKRRWRGEQPNRWEGFPVKWRFGIGPIVAFDD